MRSKRFEWLDERPVNRANFIEPWAEAGLTVISSPHDPSPSLKIENGIVTEMAEQSMGMPSQDIARLLVDINVPRAEVLKVARACTGAKLADIVRHLNVLEMTMGLTKMRARRTPANQAHITNRLEHPALLAARFTSGTNW